MKGKILFLALLIATLAYVGYYVSPKLPYQVKIQNVSVVTVETEAFTAVKQQNNWILTLKPKHYSDKIKSITISYNGTFYGVFLLSDKIYLPVFVAPSVDLTLSCLDKEGKPLTSESFTVGETSIEQQSQQHIPTSTTVGH